MQEKHSQYGIMKCKRNTHVHKPLYEGSACVLQLTPCGQPHSVCGQCLQCHACQAKSQGPFHASRQRAYETSNHIFINPCMMCSLLLIQMLLSCLIVAAQCHSYEGVHPLQQFLGPNVCDCNSWRWQQLLFHGFLTCRPLENTVMHGWCGVPI